jgi:hypothetical protein
MFAVIWLLIGVYNVESVRNVECDKATKKDFQSSEYIMFRIPVTCAPVAFPGYMCACCLPRLYVRLLPSLSGANVGRMGTARGHAECNEFNHRFKLCPC